MGRSARTSWLKAVALVVALASLTINFGLIDLIDGYTGYIDQERNQVLDADWGLVFGVILPLGLLAQLRRPERRIGGIQQTVVVALALAMAGVAGEAWRYVALAAGLAGVGAVLVALHPARAIFLARGPHPDVVMLALAAVAAVPSLGYALRMVSAQRGDLPPADAVSNGLHHWPVTRARYTDCVGACAARRPDHRPQGIPGVRRRPLSHGDHASMCRDRHARVLAARSPAPAYLAPSPRRCAVGADR
jgi:hypothetical protein